MVKQLFAGDVGPLHLRRPRWGLPSARSTIRPRPRSPHGSEFLFGLAGGARLPFGRDGAWSAVVGPEIFGATVLRSFFGGTGTAVEGLLTTRFEGTTSAGECLLRVMLGAGLGSQQLGAPGSRVVRERRDLSREDPDDGVHAAPDRRAGGGGGRGRGVAVACAARGVSPLQASRRQWQREPEAAAAARPRLHPDLALVGLDQALHGREPEPDAVRGLAVSPGGRTRSNTRASAPGGEPGPVSSTSSRSDAPSSAREGVICWTPWLSPPAYLMALRTRLERITASTLGSAGDGRHGDRLDDDLDVAPPVAGAAPRRRLPRPSGHHVAATSQGRGRPRQREEREEGVDDVVHPRCVWWRT